jgi:hypothetical protein
MGAKEWFGQFITEHKERNPHKEFRTYELPGKQIVYAGWVRAFDRRGIDYRIATNASIEFQAQGQQYPEHHLPTLIELAGRVKIRQDQVHRDQQRVTERALESTRSVREAKIREAWIKAPEEMRQKHREWARAEYPQMIRLENYIEFMARSHWIETLRASRREPVNN